jgi:hypothetical protein
MLATLASNNTGICRNSIVAGYLLPSSGQQILLRRRYMHCMATKKLLDDQQNGDNGHCLSSNSDACGIVINVQMLAFCSTKAI